MVVAQIKDVEAVQVREEFGGERTGEGVVGEIEAREIGSES